MTDIKRFKATDCNIYAVLMRDYDLTNDFHYDCTSIADDGEKYDIYVEYPEKEDYEDYRQWWCVKV